MRKYILRNRLFFLQYVPVVLLIVLLVVGLSTQRLSAVVPYNNQRIVYLNGTQVTSDNIEKVQISQDGRYVAF